MEFLNLKIGTNLTHIVQEYHDPDMLFVFSTEYKYHRITVVVFHDSMIAFRYFIDYVKEHFTSGCCSGHYCDNKKDVCSEFINHDCDEECDPKCWFTEDLQCTPYKLKDLMTHGLKFYCEECSNSDWECSGYQFSMVPRNGSRNSSGQLLNLDLEF
jgi:hypothetical protein